MRLQADAQHWKSAAVKYEQNRDEFSDYASGVERERDFFERGLKQAKARIAELEKETAMLSGRKA
ncbi:hypothetical protein [Komagataeibacter saccharivorans]|nr:hypothetical protein [Komagataeibacter saccharivorans]